MTRISKDGGIEDMVKSSHKPINRVEKVTIRSLQEPLLTDKIDPPKITYGTQGPNLSPRNYLV